MVSLLAMFENALLKKVVCYIKEEEFHLREVGCLLLVTSIGKR
jgi:hypothetical protein